jgi:hypothetical protein
MTMEQNAKIAAVEIEAVVTHETEREDKPAGLRTLADWELVGVGGGETIVCW